MSVKEVIQAHLLHTIVPLMLILAAPNWSLILIHTSVHHRGSWKQIYDAGFVEIFKSAWKNALTFDINICIFLVLFSVWSALSLYIFGGKQYQGPVTKSGHKPTYYHSGFRYFIATLIAIGLIFNLKSFSALFWFKKLIPLAGSLNLLGLVTCLILLIKGKIYPSPGDYGSSGYPIFDFYWGLELYPRIGKHFDIKLFTNSRFGLMLWQIIVLLSWKAQHELSGWNWSMCATSILQTIYLAKFYWWEDGYMKSLDIILDRAGFYICWGCIYLVPTFYTLTSIFMVHNAPSVSWKYGISYLIGGMAMIFLNFWADYQRLLARNTDGKCYIWGSPAKIIRASYQDEEKVEKSSLLLASGFWGLSRHINYIFELGAAFMWAFPAGTISFIPYAYLLFLTILLVHRSYRDEVKCHKKYKQFWVRYCEMSKYRLIPYVY